MSGTTVEAAFTRELMATRSCAGLARSLVISHLVKWNAHEFMDRATLVISELFNNAIRVSGTAENIQVHASLHAYGLWLGVSDSSQANPVKRVTIDGIDDVDSWSEEDFGGWGLQIIQSCSDRVWIESIRSGGKWVCAELRYSREV